MLPLALTGAIVHVRDEGAVIFGQFHLISAIVGIRRAFGMLDQFAQCSNDMFDFSGFGDQLAQCQ